MLKGNLTISRPTSSRSDENPYISITIRDAGSRINFLSVEVPLASFAEALTGLSEVEVDMVVRGLGNVGKVREFESISVVLSQAYLDAKGVSIFSRDKLESFLATDPDGVLTPYRANGWTVDTSLRRQNSITTHNGGFDHRVHLSRHRYVDPQPTEEAK